MRTVLATLFAVLLFVPTLFARNCHDWEHVEKLKRGTTVLISLWSGDIFSGRVESVSHTALRLRIFDPEDIGIAQLQEFGRPNIRRIVHPAPKLARSPALDAYGRTDRRWSWPDLGGHL